MTAVFPAPLLPVPLRPGGDRRGAGNRGRREGPAVLLVIPGPRLGAGASGYRYRHRVPQDEKQDEPYAEHGAEEGIDHLVPRGVVPEQVVKGIEVHPSRPKRTHQLQQHHQAPGLTPVQFYQKATEEYPAQAPPKQRHQPDRQGAAAAGAGCYRPFRQQPDDPKIAEGQQRQPGPEQTGVDRHPVDAVAPDQLDGHQCYHQHQNGEGGVQHGATPFRTTPARWCWGRGRQRQGAGAAAGASGGTGRTWAARRGRRRSRSPTPAPCPAPPGRRSW